VLREEGWDLDTLEMPRALKEKLIEEANR